MANILIMGPTAISALAVSRGSGGANLLTADPKEVWTDSAVGSVVNIDIDLGANQSINTVFLGSILGAVAGATWTITGGVAAYTTTTLKASGALRANDASGQSPGVSHGFWTGNAATVRYLRLALTQPAGNPVLQAGNVMIGSAFQPTWNKEWGSGRQVIDTGSATRLPGGGFAMVEGARPGSYRWTLGDLTDAEVDTLYALQMDRGETRPILVVEDPVATTGLRNRIHYGRFTALRAYERRNPKQTRWDFSMEEWI